MGHSSNKEGISFIRKGGKIIPIKGKGKGAPPGAKAPRKAIKGQKPKRRSISQVDKRRESIKKKFIANETRFGAQGSKFNKVKKLAIRSAAAFQRAQGLKVTKVGGFLGFGKTTKLVGSRRQLRAQKEFESSFSQLRSLGGESALDVFGTGTVQKAGRRLNKALRKRNRSSI